ncbi:MAG: hypothetical protein CMC15_18680 [Flavobacteriaceae bacterium]|nr:hypothetical protein [Flavobacteriaceae bacterium]|tara:strand:- start:147 stop:404 length:258 start_codon:yes stop_codon:yes gene_type:complete
MCQKFISPEQKKLFKIIHEHFKGNTEKVSTFFKQPISALGGATLYELLDKSDYKTVEKYINNCMEAYKKYDNLINGRMENSELML